MGIAIERENLEQQIRPMFSELGQRVETYQVWYTGTGRQYEMYHVTVYLFAEEGWLGKIMFVDDATADAMPHDRQGPDGEIFMFLPLRQYPYIVDLLRNEKPVHYSFNNTQAYLTTAKEPVGAGERNYRLPLRPPTGEVNGR